MSEQQPCDDISSVSTQNTSLPGAMSLQPGSGKSDKKMQKKHRETESVEDEQLTRFQPFDLKSLTFKPIGSDQEVDVWHASASEFHGYIQQYARGFRMVNIDIWPLAERLAIVNVIWTHCQKTGRPFPFGEGQHVVPHVDGTPVPDVDTSASEAG